jgi:hypothetical protein
MYYYVLLALAPPSLLFRRFPSAHLFLLYPFYIIPRLSTTATTTNSHLLVSITSAPLVDRVVEAAAAVTVILDSSGEAEEEEKKDGMEEKLAGKVEVLTATKDPWDELGAEKLLDVDSLSVAEVDASLDNVAGTSPTTVVSPPRMYVVGGGAICFPVADVVRVGSSEGPVPSMENCGDELAVEPRTRM